MQKPPFGAAVRLCLGVISTGERVTTDDFTEGELGLETVAELMGLDERYYDSDEYRDGISREIAKDDFDTAKWKFERLQKCQEIWAEETLPNEDLVDEWGRLTKRTRGRIYNVIKSLDLTFKEVADQHGYTNWVHCSNVFDGHTEVSPRARQRIATWLGIMEEEVGAAPKPPDLRVV